MLQKQLYNLFQIANTCYYFIYLKPKNKAQKQTNTLI